MRSSECLESKPKMAGTSLVGLREVCMPSSNDKNNSNVWNQSPPVSFDVAAYARILQNISKLYPYDSSAVAASISALGPAAHLPAVFPGVDNIGRLKAAHNGNSDTECDDTNQGNGLKIEEKISLNLKSYKDTHKIPLDLSCPGLKSLYSNYKRISLNQVKPKIVEDVWVENDYVLTWTDSKIAAYNPAQKLFMCVDCECVGFLSRVAEHWLGAHANLRVFNCPRCPYTSAWSRCVKMHLTRQHNEQFADTTMWKENSSLMEVTKLMQELRTNVENKIDSTHSLSDKRFYCPHCPYATDRRDLYTRHENIHKDNKPFHCYICTKQFNRADHVKKHFVRMHPDSEYDISKIRKQPIVKPASSQTSSVSGSDTSSDNSKSNSMPIQLEVNLRASALPAPKSESSVSIPHSPISCDVSSKNLAIQQDVKPLLPESVSDISFVDLTSSPTTKNSPLSFSKTPVSETSNRSRRKGDRAYTCPYCQWTGTDNWCLKRHMNTHIKPFACIMCDYKAARAERLSTHVWKVHNKRICNKCNFLADSQDRLLEHTREEHHNNPYSRRHICSSCGMSFDTRANLETHIHLAHSRPRSPNDIVEITPIALSEKVQAIAQDLSLKRPFSGEEVLSLICPIEECSLPFEASGMLADHVRQEHGGMFSSRCPHCSYNLTHDELSKDHWLTHHDDVCNACVHVFTSVYGPQLWKKVHAHPQSTDSPLNSIVSGLNKKKSEPDSNSPNGFCSSQSCNDSSSHHSNPSSPTSECPDNDCDRLSKRQRKQSCPKKVITIHSDTETDPVKLMDIRTDKSSICKNKIFSTKQKKKPKRCLRCPHKPIFSSFTHLQVHSKIKHKIRLKRRKLVIS